MQTTLLASKEIHLDKRTRDALTERKIVRM